MKNIALLKGLDDSVVDWITIIYDQLVEPCLSYQFISCSFSKDSTPNGLLFC
jgi:hypothetical protein